MFRSAFQIRKINGGGDHSTTTHLLCFLLRLQNNQNPSLLLKIRSHTSTNQRSSCTSSSSSFVVSYLINSCGLSEDKAVSASKKIHFETSSRPDSVLTLLENNGFTKPYISKLITKRPCLLSSYPCKTFKPKFEFFNSKGLSGLDLVKLISQDSNLLLRSLENQIIATFAFLKSNLHTDSNVIAALKRSTWVLSVDPGKDMVLNIGVLGDQGVPKSNISYLLTTQPRALLVNADRFKEIVEEIKGLGFDPLRPTFLHAVRVLTSMTKLSWEAKLDFYRRWGWSEDEIRTAFRKQPMCMLTSGNKIMAVMDFFVNQMGYDPSLMAEHPTVFTYSLEKTIVPRFRVIRFLISKGLVKKNIPINSVLALGKKSFLNKYVIKYEHEFPELLKEYN